MVREQARGLWREGRFDLDLVPAGFERFDGIETPSPAGGEVRDEVHQRAPHRAGNDGDRDDSQPAEAGREQAEQQPDEETEPGAGGRATKRGLACSDTTENMLDDTHIEADNGDALDGKTCVGETIDGRLGAGIVSVFRNCLLPAGSAVYSNSSGLLAEDGSPGVSVLVTVNSN